MLLMNSPEGIKALNLLKDLKTKKYIAGDTDIVAAGELQLFAQQKIASTICWGTSNAKNYATKDFTAISVPFPSSTGKPALEYLVNGFCVFDNKDAARSAAAKKFITFICDDPVVGKESVVKTGAFPLRSSFGDLYPGNAEYKLLASWTKYYGGYYNTMASFAGGEANVAVSLANYGEESAFVTYVPDNALGQSAINAVRHWGVDTRWMCKGGPRLGIYFIEKGASQRSSTVLYDRKGSSVALSTVKDYDWDKIFEGADWFHFTGITPALSDSLVDVCLEALKTAKRKGLTVSCDLNYRKNLWSHGDERQFQQGIPKGHHFPHRCLQCRCERR